MKNNAFDLNLGIKGCCRVQTCQIHIWSVPLTEDIWRPFSHASLLTQQTLWEMLTCRLSRLQMKEALMEEVSKTQSLWMWQCGYCLIWFQEYDFSLMKKRKAHLQNIFVSLILKDTLLSYQHPTRLLIYTHINVKYIDYTKTSNTPWLVTHEILFSCFKDSYTFFTT